jgi:Ca2+/Na+ antiporter
LTRITILSVLVSAALLLYILEMVRRRRLREEYSILWLAGGVIILVGIYYPPSFLFLIGMLFILLILIHFSITISKLYQMNKKMAQEIAHLKQERGEELGEEANPTAPSPKNPQIKGN